MRSAEDARSSLYVPLEVHMERSWMGERRARLLKGARGSVLEIWGSTGANLPHYRGVGRVTVAEPDPFMRRRLNQKLGSARVPVEVSVAGAEELPFHDGSFDTVVSTLVVCTVHDQETALEEIRRVLAAAVYRARSGPRVRCQPGGPVQNLWGWILGGCRPGHRGGRVRDRDLRELPPVPFPA